MGPSVSGGAQYARESVGKTAGAGQGHGPPALASNQQSRYASRSKTSMLAGTSPVNSAAGSTSNHRSRYASRSKTSTPAFPSVSQGHGVAHPGPLDVKTAKASTPASTIDCGLE